MTPVRLGKRPKVATATVPTGVAVSRTVADLLARLDGARLGGPLDPARAADAVVVDASHDSRAVSAGTLFCAMVGEISDGHDHAAAAVERGATALLVQRSLDLPVAQLVVADSRLATGPAAALVQGDPSRAMTVIGVTGTNGKTTTTYLLEHAFAAAGLGTGVIGTIESRVHGEALAGVRTTPEGTDLQRLLRSMLDRGVDAVSMEASSHGLAMHRVDGIDFDVAVFLNLSQDHLDFHADMEDYFRAKERLFTLARTGVVCVEDDWGARLAAEAPIGVVTFGRPDRCVVPPDFRIEELSATSQGCTFLLVGDDGQVALQTRLLGEVNALNAAAAHLAAVAGGVEPIVAAAGIAACPSVPGRLERVPHGDGPTVLVDYAHTPDAVEQVVRTARTLAEGGRVVIVVGCGGDRDRGKRGPMGAAAAAADLTILTSDNPRSEDPEAILDAMVAGAEASEAATELVREVDRATAIDLAISRAAAEDVVVIAGKGHELGQAFADRTEPFDDRLVAADALARRWTS